MSEVTRACNEDCRTGAREENAAYGESGRDATWFCARQRNNKVIYEMFHTLNCRFEIKPTEL